MSKDNVWVNAEEFLLETESDAPCECDDITCPSCYPVTESSESDDFDDEYVDDWERASDILDDAERERQLLDLEDKELSQLTGEEDRVSIHEPEEDVSDLIAEIEYYQDMGISGTSKTYRYETLLRMSPEQIRSIHSVVTGDLTEAVADELEGRSYGSEDVSELIADILDAQEFADESATHYSMDTLLKLSPSAIRGIHSKVVGLTETTAGGIASAAGGMGKVQSRTGVYGDDEVEEAVKSLQNFEENGKVAKVSYDSDWEEYVVQLFIDGEHNESADYYTSDEEDAMGTAKQMVLDVQRLNEINEGETPYEVIAHATMPNGGFYKAVMTIHADSPAEARTEAERRSRMRGVESIEIESINEIDSSFFESKDLSRIKILAGL